MTGLDLYIEVKYRLEKSSSSDFRYLSKIVVEDAANKALSD
jgi:hypothetical protein